MIRRRSSTVLVAVIMLLASTTVAYGAAAEAGLQPSGIASVADSTQSSRDTVRLALTRPLSVADVVVKLRGLDVDRVELIQWDMVNGIVYTSGVVTDGNNLSPDLYANEMASVFDDMAREFDQSAAGTVPDKAETLAMADAMESAARSFAATDARIEAIVVTASAGALRALADWELVGTSTVVLPATTGASQPPTNRAGESGVGTLDAGSGGNCDNAWWPYTGRISTQYSSSVPNRYVWQRLKWSQWRIDNLYDCDGFNTSYEHEAWYNNYDGLHFLSSSVKSWSSSLPDAYLDTGFLDGDGELGMTIGTGAAYQLDAGVNYTTYIRTAPGNATSDTGKVNGQRGLNLCPIGLTGGWCVFARETEKLLPAWSRSAPGRTDWTHY